MKNQYFGDINDYRKYGLLRQLAGAGLSIGVCWLLTDDDGGSDGRRRAYLAKPARWSRYDPPLYDALRRLLGSGGRADVRQAQEWTLIPGATYFTRVLSDGLEQRDAYFNAAFEALRRCQLLFFDPDTGIEVQSIGRGRRGSAAYVYWAELREAYALGHSLLIYQHFPRVERTRFVPFLAERLRDELGAPHVTGMMTPHVAFFLAHGAAHQEALEKGVASAEATWRGQIDVWRSTSRAV